MANGRVSGPVVALSATGEQLAMGPPGPPGTAGPAGAAGPPGPSGEGLLLVAEVQGTSTVETEPGVLYEVTTTAGTSGNVLLKTDTNFTVAPVGSTLKVLRTDASGNTLTLDPPTGGTVQDPSTNVLGSSASFPTQNQSASYYLGATLALRIY